MIVKKISQLTYNYPEKFDSLNHGVMVAERGWFKRFKVVLFKQLENADSYEETEDFAYEDICSPRVKSK